MMILLQSDFELSGLTCSPVLRGIIPVRVIHRPGVPVSFCLLCQFCFATNYFFPFTWPKQFFQKHLHVPPAWVMSSTYITAQHISCYLPSALASHFPIMPNYLDSTGLHSTVCAPSLHTALGPMVTFGLGSPCCPSEPCSDQPAPGWCCRSPKGPWPFTAHCLGPQPLFSARAHWDICKRCSNSINWHSIFKYTEDSRICTKCNNSHI